MENYKLELCTNNKEKYFNIISKILQIVENEKDCFNLQLYQTTGFSNKKQIDKQNKSKELCNEIGLKSIRYRNKNIYINFYQHNNAAQLLSLFNKYGIYMDSYRLNIYDYIDKLITTTLLLPNENKLYKDFKKEMLLIDWDYHDQYQIN